MHTRNKVILAAGSIIGLLTIGTVFYHLLERWDWVDSFYFTGVTLLTIGYGDLVPTTDIAKIFTVLFALTGVSTFLFSLSIITEYYFEKREQRLNNGGMLDYAQKIGIAGDEVILKPARELHSKITKMLKK
ncbi:MAG: potassium channel family protein [archaeon]|nr:potassium channel family protein [archaeon]